jgi:AraC family transcriptional activator of mtrCDE
MSTDLLASLLVKMNVDVDAFLICEISEGTRLLCRPLRFIELHYVLAGRMHLKIPGMNEIVCDPGSLVLVPPNTIQAIATDTSPIREVVASENCSVVQDGMLLADAAAGKPGDLRIVCGAIAVNVSGSQGPFDLLEVPLKYDLGDLAIVRCAYATMLDEVVSPTLGSRALIGALMKSCLVFLIRRCFFDGFLESRLRAALSHPRLAKVTLSIMNRPAEHHTVASLALTAGMSRAKFAREFKRAFGMAPMAFVTKTRLHRATEMLRSSNLPVKVISSRAGFSSRSHFSRAFRRLYGSDPTTYRNT